MRAPVRVAVSRAVRGHPHDPAMTTTLPHCTVHTSTVHTTGLAGSGLSGTGRSTHPLLVGLGREWQATSHRPSAVRRARTWHLAVEFGSLDGIVAATGWYATADERHAAGRCTTAEVDAVMQRLLLAARTDDLAARVVLQRLLPGLVSLARRWQRRHDGDALADVLAAAWWVIRQFPVERRPQHLVANLLNDCEYHAYRRAGRRLLVQTPVEERHLDGADDCHRVEPLHELVDVVACTSSLTAHDRRLLGLLLSGRSLVEAAAELDVSERTVRNHRDLMVSRMRQAVAA